MLQKPRTTRSYRHKRLISLLLLAGLLLPALALAPTAAPSQTTSRELSIVPKAQPRLLQLAAQRPGDTVSVIVQKQTAGDSSERQVAALGGRVTMDLHIINAFAAELPAGAVPALARSEGVRWISYDAPVVDAAKASTCDECINTSYLKESFVTAIRAEELWNEAPAYLQGQGMTVAIVDSGINQHYDLGGQKGVSKRILTAYKTNSNTNNASDSYAHGTHIAGIIGGDGSYSAGKYMGVAPKVNLVNVKVSDDIGQASTKDVVAGLQWIYENKDTYNIRVVNLSLNSSEAESYHTSPLDAAVEILWFNGIVVVVSAGNNGSTDSGVLFPPANDPFVITVGAINDMGTKTTDDDELAPFSAYGVTQEGHSKPEIAAPGTNIIAAKASDNAVLVQNHPDHMVKEVYFRMSGTSMAAAVTTGAITLLLQDEPDLTPDQVKHRLMATAKPYPSDGVGAGFLDIYAAVHGTTTESANTGTEVSQLLTTGSEPVTWDSATWNSVNWGSVNWGSVNWGSVNWGSVNWGSVNWDQ